MDLKASVISILYKMSRNDILTYNTFTNESFDYNQPRVNANGGKSVNLFNTSAKTALNLSTPLMLTYGLSDYEGNQRYDLTLQFPDRGTNSKADIFLDVLTKFEQRLKSDAIKNAKEWFGKPKMTEDVVDALWTPMLKYPKDKATGEYDMSRSPTLRVKAPFYADSNKWDCEVYDVNNDRLFPDPDNSMTPLDYLKKGTQAGLLIKCGGLWFANGKFGVTWRLLQAKIRPRATITGSCQIALDDDDVAVMTKSNEVEDTSDAGEEDVRASTMVESDGEEEEEEEEAPAPEPEVKKKKVVRKKA